MVSKAMQTNNKSKYSNLLVRIIIAIILAIIIGELLKLLPTYYHFTELKTYFGLDFTIPFLVSTTSPAVIITKTFMVFNSIFSQFLSFIIPLLIIGLIAPGIGNLGRGAGKLLLITIAIAYIFTIFSGFLSYIASYITYPALLSGTVLSNPNTDVSAGFGPYFTIPMPPILSTTSALIFAFVLGVGLAVTKTDKLMAVMEDFREIINKTIASVIIPLLPIYIFTVFLNMTMVGTLGELLIVFLKIIVFIFVLTVILLLILFGIAGAISKQNPLKAIKYMLPAYLTALGTSSSAATIPVTYACSLRLGVREEISSFVIPLCATINLTGSMLKIVATSFAIIYTTGMDISFPQMVGFIFTLAIAMVAAPGVPGGAIMTALAPLASVLGFTAETNALMITLYVIMDSFGTATNVTCDGAVASIVDKIYKKEHEHDSVSNA